MLGCRTSTTDTSDASVVAGGGAVHRCTGRDHRIRGMARSDGKTMRYEIHTYRYCCDQYSQSSSSLCENELTLEAANIEFADYQARELGWKTANWGHVCPRHQR